MLEPRRRSGPWTVFVLLLAVASLAACSRGQGPIHRPQQDACTLADSDRDGLPDVWEIHKYRTDPFSPDSDGDGLPDSDWRERREYTYTVRAIVEVGVPLPPLEELNTISQDVRLLGQRGTISELEVVLYPGAVGGAGVEKYSVQNGCALAQFETLDVDPAFAEEMRELASTTTSPQARTEALLDSLFGQTRRTVPFNAFYLSKKDGDVSVEPLARALLSDPEADPRELWDRELDPATMWNRRERGECTSSAVLGAAALGAIEVPSRLALFIPLGVAPKEVLREIWDDRALRGARGWRPGDRACSSHTVVEIFHEDRWLLTDEQRIRRTPFELGMGPMLQLRTASSVGDLIEPEFWGAACAQNGPLEGTRNAYRIVHVSDAWGAHAGDLELEGIGPAPPSTLTITDIFPFESPKRPSFIPVDAVEDPSRHFLAKVDLDGTELSAVPYFYRCADKSLPPFRFVRGYWGPYFLLEKVGGALTQDTPRRASDKCRWVLEDTDFAN